MIIRILATCLILVLAERAEGQRLSRPWVSTPKPRLGLYVASSSSPAADYRWEGVLIGSVSVGVGFALLGRGLCQSDDNAGSCTGATIKGALLGSVTGAIVGGLIGGLFPKRTSPRAN